MLIVTAALLFGLTVKPAQRGTYVNSLTNPFKWIVDHFPGSGKPGDAAPARVISPATSALPVASPVAQPDSAAADTSSPATPEVITRSEPSSPGSPADSSAGGGTWYVVKRGQTLRDIARITYGDASQWKRIWFYNLERLAQPDNLKSGLEIFLPEPGELSQAEAARVEELINSRP